MRKGKNETMGEWGERRERHGQTHSNARNTNRWPQTKTHPESHVRTHTCTHIPWWKIERHLKPASSDGVLWIEKLLETVNSERNAFFTGQCEEYLRGFAEKLCLMPNCSAPVSCVK